ncbi:MAG: DNA polymerase I [Opitutales bacterium]|nr:DNA polymerase I [Opitutales bacterium]
MKLMVLDGNSIINRAFYGIRILSTRDGIFTNAVYGFLSILSRLLDAEKPDALCVCFDVHAPTFRHEQFAAYKAQRKPMPEELRPQIPLMKEVLAAMRIPVYALAGWEADDLIGTISTRCAEEKCECVIVTGDRDSLQLIRDGVRVLLVVSRMGKTETTDYTEEKFREDYGFEPKKIIDLKALWGDTSDNIPGVPGIGEKTARELITKIGGLERIYEQIDTADIRDSVKKKLLAGKESAWISYDLATIRTDAPIAFSPGENRRKDYDVPALYALFKKLEFSKLIAKWNLAPPEAENADLPLFSGAAAAPAGNGELDSLIAACRSAERSFLLFPEDEAGVDFSRVEILAGVQHASVDLAGLASDERRRFLEKLFASDIRKVSSNLKAIFRKCFEENLPAEGFIFDLALADYLLDPLKKPPMPENAREMSEVFEKQLPALEQAGMARLYREIEFPLCRVLAEMEFHGIAADRAKLEEFSAEMDKAATAAQQAVFELAGTAFNLNSPKQLGEVLFEKLGLPAGKKTKTGYSTDADVLKDLAPLHPAVAKIIEFRQFAKLKTIADGLIAAIAADGRIHTTFNMTATATGRLSSSNPNLQNIPTRGELGNEVRRMFVAGNGNTLVDADYSQIELRVLAHIADDAAMREAFNRGGDIHAVTACRVFGVDPIQITPTMRRHAKAVNFGIVYGVGEFSLSKSLGITRKAAKHYIESYLDKYAGVREYMKKVVEKAKEDGFVATLSGRRRAMPELKASNHNVRAFGERVALNAPIQGSAADIIKIAMLRVHARLKREVPAAKIVLQIHDELIVEAPVAETEKVKALLSEEMSAAFPLAVPLVAEATAGSNWLEAHA